MDFQVKKNVMVEMRDGVALATDLWLPSELPAPTLLARLPYGKDTIASGAYGYPLNPDTFRLVEAGYAVVWQDCRGRHRSHGEFTPVVNEASDGEDTVDWISRQEWCDGNVATFGSSYLGFTQLENASRGPRALKAIAPSVTSGDYYRGPFYSIGGAQSWYLAQYWPAMLAATATDPAESRPPADPQVVAALAASMLDPLGYWPAARDRSAADTYWPWWHTWLAHPARDEYWQDVAVVDRAEDIVVPGLHLGGWFDLMINETVRTYRALRDRAGSEAARDGQQLIIGPWDHLSYEGVYPDRNFGPMAAAWMVDITKAHLDFYDRFVRGRDAEAAASSRVRYFLMGVDEWREAEDWPPAGTRTLEFFLTSGRGANTASGDGVLVGTIPGTDGSDTYTYDPLQPVPTVGGQMMLSPLGRGAGPADQRDIEARPDVLCYTSAPMAEPLEVVGHLSLVLFAATSAEDTDFAAKLVDVHPDGRALYLTDGILRARYRESLSEPKPLVPGDVYELTIDLSVTANVFLPGHRIRLEITSSNFPRYDRNTNTGGHIAGEDLRDSVVARNVVLHGPSTPSRLRLPVMVP